MSIIKSAGKLAVDAIIMSAKAGYEGGKYAVKTAKKFREENKEEIDEFKNELDSALKGKDLAIAKGCLAGASALNHLSISLAQFGARQISDKSNKEA